MQLLLGIAVDLFILSVWRLLRLLTISVLRAMARALRNSFRFIARISGVRIPSLS